LEQATGIEPAARPWEGRVLPLYDACNLSYFTQSSQNTQVDLLWKTWLILYTYSRGKDMKKFLEKNVLSLFAMALSSFSLVAAVAIPGVNGSDGLPGSLGPIGSTGPQGPVGPEGSPGSQGPSGTPGESGLTPYIGVNGNWWIGEEDSGVSASGSITEGMMIPKYGFHFTQAETQWYESERKTLPFSDQISQQAYINQKVDEENFIRITSATELFAIDQVEGKYILASAIDLSQVVDWQPIRVGIDQVFSGILDGAGFTVSGLQAAKISAAYDTDTLGLFATLKNATIRNLTLEGFQFNFLSVDDKNFHPRKIGTLAGRIESSLIENLTIHQAQVSGIEELGFVAGVINQSFLNTVDVHVETDPLLPSSSTLSGLYRAGGISGYVFDSIFLHVDVQFIVLTMSTPFGGVVGESFNNRYVNVRTNLAYYSDPNQLDSLITIGGITGVSMDDRFMNVVSAGFFEFIYTVPNQQFFHIGGITGEALNSSYFLVVNLLQIDFNLSALVTNEFVNIVSVGGIVGNAGNLLIDHAINQGTITIQEPEDGLSSNYYDFNPFDTIEYPIEYFGGIVGYFFDSGFISHAVNVAPIHGVVEVGGIVGSSGGGYGFSQKFIMIQQSANLGDVSGYSFVAGIVGLMDESTNFTLANVINYGKIEGYLGVGGLVGVASPFLGVRINIINSANFGHLRLVGFDYGSGLGGLIGVAFPLFVYFDDPFSPIFAVFGEIHLYNSFNVGQIDVEGLVEFEGATGSILGVRLLLVMMYGVSALAQSITYEVGVYDPDLNMVVSTGEFITQPIPVVGIGNRVDVTTIENPAWLLDRETFIYRSVWNFQSAWQWADDQSPYPLFPQMPHFTNG